MTTANVRKADGLALTTGGKREPLTITYDATSRSYTVVVKERSQQFLPSDRSDRIAGEAQYQATNESGLSDHLTLAPLGYSTGTVNRYVALGYWQHDKVSGSDIQDLDFHTFTYGMDTPATAIPRTGFASWDTDIFGLLTRPDERMRTMQGTGRFDVDFANATFLTTGELAESDVVGSGGSSTLQLDGGGTLTSDGRLSGTISYSGASGSLIGGFYGPQAEELGASFLAVNKYGSVLNGAMTGRRNTQTVPSANMTLLNLQIDQILEGQFAGQTNPIGTTSPETPVSRVWSTPVYGLHLTAEGPSTIEMLIGGIENLTRDSLQPRTNFIRYTGQSQPVSSVTVDFFRPGPANTELALTYTSFAMWRWTTYDAPGGGAPTINDSSFFLAYGIKPPPTFLAGMSGSASYKGVIYGIGSTREGARYDLGGTSTFLVDFSAGSYSGTLQISGKDVAGRDHDFGRYGFTSTLNGQGFDAAFLNSNPTWNQVIEPAFYGPQGQEIGATFNILTGEYGAPQTTYLDGITVAKQQ